MKALFTWPKSSLSKRSRGMALLMGGTVARLVREGRTVTYVIVTNGSEGSADRGVTSTQLVPIRVELKTACVYLGAAAEGFARTALCRAASLADQGWRGGR